MSAKKQVLTLVALSAASIAAMAQTSVNLYGIVDAAVRFESNHGATANQSLKTLAPGGMSQSRLGINVSEDMGDGWRAVVNMEHRLLSDSGNVAAGDFWRQAWVGVITPVGRITLGRQYNVMFDLTTSTYAAYRYSPYIEQFKPELAMNIGNRQSNMVKYALTQGGFTFEAQVSAGEAAGDKTVGMMARYQTGGLAVGGSMINAKDPGGKQVKGMAFGGSYTAGAFQGNLSYAKNDFDAGFNTTLALGYSAAMVFAAANGTAASPVNVLSQAGYANLKERTLLATGFTYQVTPQFNIGAQLYKFSQSNYGTGIESDATMFSILGDYALSKRTDVYAGMDRVKFDKGGLVSYTNGARERTGYMTGVRHRF
jgi:predicted porin